MRSQIIALALQRLIFSSVKADADSGATRSFFRLDGFDDDVYRGLLDYVRHQPYAHGRKIEARITRELGKEYCDFELEIGRTATSYRNSLPQGQALILIFNQITADRQSLTNLFTINESLLSGKYLEFLLSAAFDTLTPEEVAVLRRFVTALFAVRQPQLCSFVDFLMEVKKLLSVDYDMAGAIGHALPNVQLFRSVKIAEQLRAGKAVGSLLTRVNKAATQTLRAVERKDIDKYLTKVQTVEFEDDVAVGGLAKEQKRKALTDYMRGFDNVTALRIDWQEVDQVLFGRTGGKGKVKDETARLKGLGSDLVKLLTGDGQSLDRLPSEDQQVIKSLLDGQRPDQEAVDVLVEEQGHVLGPKLAKELAERYGTSAAHSTEDFTLGVTSVCVQLIKDVGVIPEGLTLRVKALEVEKASQQILHAFRHLYQSVPLVMPSIQFDYSALSAVEAPSDEDDDSSSTDESKRDSESLSFLVEVFRHGEVLRSGKLVWVFRPYGPHWDLVAALRSERVRISEGKVPVPLFEQVKAVGSRLEPFALSTPLGLGFWWTEPKNLGEAWREAPTKRYGLRPEAVSSVTMAIDRLEGAYAVLLEGTPETGIFPYVDALVLAYQDLLQTAADTLNTAHEIAAFTGLLNRAWVIHNPQDLTWAILPLLHPLKLYWMVNRCRHLNSLLERLAAPGARPAAIDMNALRREIPQRFASAYFPGVLALADESSKRVFLPADEFGGVELFRPATASMGYSGTSTSIDSEDATSLRVCSDQIVRVLGSYFETHPFAKDGTSVLMANVQSPALPLTILKDLAKKLPNKPTIRLSIHAPSSGAVVYGAVNDWLQEHEELSLRSEHSYFPPVTVKVQDGDLMEVVRTQRYDTAILADVLADKGQSVVVKQAAAVEDVSMTDYLPFFPPKQNPYEWGSTVRHVVLTPPKAPTFLRLFYNLQAACLQPDQPPASASTVEFRRVLDLGEWTTRLRKLHEQCNWVVCYDINADRFLLENTGTKDVVRVIRYVMGLGPKKLHNMTVSSSGTARDEVIRRLTQRLTELLALDADYLKSLATALVDHAQELSGSVVLRATGPGTMLNELLGLVLAKVRVEDRIRAEWPDAMVSWVFLDDYQHWFGRGGKRPDLLCVATRLAGGQLQMRLVVTEAKCVEEGSFAAECTDAIVQVARGMDVLGKAFIPGSPCVDSDYWYTQLYQATVSNLEVKVEHAPLVQALDQLLEGTHSLVVSGEAWVFCYDSLAGQPQPIEVIPTADDRVVGLAANRIAVTQSLSQLLRVARPDAPEISADPVMNPQLRPVESQSGSKLGSVAVPSDESPTKGVAGSACDPDEGGTSSPGARPSPPEVKLQSEEEELAPEPIAGEHADTALVAPILEEGPQSTSQDSGSSSPGALVTLLKAYDTTGDEAEARKYAQQCLDQAISFLRKLGLRVTPRDYLVGPRVIRLKVVLSIAPDSTYEKLAKLKTNLRLNLALPTDPYIQPGSDGSVWIDIARPRPAMVGLRALLERADVGGARSETSFPLGLTVDGQPHFADLRKVPHWLVGGTSGSGKSVFIRSIVLSLMLANTPETLQFVIIDPKGDLVAFKNSPFMQHFVSSRLDMGRQALEALRAVKQQLDERLTLMIDKHGTNEIDDYHRAEGRVSLPRIVVLLEEYGDLVSDDTFRKEIEQSVQQIAAIGRSSGFHLFICTQNPVVKTVSTDIKANCSGRVALWVKTNTNSQVILDEPGAEDLLKNGDLLFKSDGPTVRLQAPFVDTMTELRPVLNEMGRRYGRQPDGGGEK